MPKKTHHALQQWNKWLQQPPGEVLLEAEVRVLFQLLEKQYGKHCLLLGSPQQQRLLDTSVMTHHLFLSPMIRKYPHVCLIESEFFELPIASGSIDLVLLPHTLEHLDNPRQLLSEACRIVKPDGHVLILGFNPLSWWGLKKNQGNLIASATVKRWLQLAECQVIRQEMFLFRPYSAHLYRKLKFLEWVGRYCFPALGGVYLLMAQNKSIPLTPIKMRWTQSLSNVRISIPKPTVRNY